MIVIWNVLEMGKAHVNQFSTIPENTCWSWRRLQHVFSVIILRLRKHLEGVLKTSCKDVVKTFCKTTLKTKNCYTEDVFKTCLEVVLKILWTHTKYYWGYLYIYPEITYLNVYLTSLYFTNLYLTTVRRIQNALIRTQ